MILFRYWFWVISILSMVAISTALIAEYIFDLEPCSMCLKQRHPYYFILFIFILFSLIHKFPRIWFYLGAQLASIYGLFYSIWHVGIEQKILPGLPGCTFTINASQSLKDLKEQILKQNIATCDEVTWSFIGLSAATINSLLLILLLLVNIIFLVKHKYEKEKQT